MKKTTYIIKVFAVSVLLLISTTLFSQQQVIQNLTVVDSLVISSLQNSSLVATNATNPPYRYLVIDPHGNVKASNNIINIPEPGGMSLDISECDTTPGWAVEPAMIYACPAWTRVGIGTEVPHPDVKLDVRGVGYFDKVGIRTFLPEYPLHVNGKSLIEGDLEVKRNAATKGVIYATGAYNSTLWTANGTGAYGLGIAADGKGHIYSGINNYTPVVSFTGGNVGINCTSPQYNLQVNGTVKATLVRVTATGCDFVFEDKYKLPSIAERKAFIKAYNHLPNIKPAKDMQENGMDISATAEGLLQNIEEISLYQINHDEKIITHDEKIEMLLKQQEELKIENQKLKEEMDLIKSLLNNK